MASQMDQCVGLFWSVVVSSQIPLSSCSTLAVTVTVTVSVPVSISVATVHSAIALLVGWWVVISVPKRATNLDGSYVRRHQVFVGCDVYFCWIESRITSGIPMTKENAWPDKR